MTIMAVSTNRGAHVAVRDRLRVNTLAIRKKRTVADAAALHHGSFSVTAAASVGGVLPVNGRPGIRGRQDRRHITIARMTIDARSALAPTLNRLRVKTVIVRSVRVSVKLRAAEIRQSRSWRVTTLALKVRGNRLSR